MKETANISGWVASMRRPLLVVTLLLLGGASFSAVAPRHEWTFESRDPRGGWSDTGDAKTKYRLYGKACVGRGRHVSTGLVADGKEKSQLPGAMIDFATFTVEFAFRPTSLPAPGKRAFLFDYQFWSWGRNRWSIALEGDGRVSFIASKKDDIDFNAVSAPVKLQLGIFHTLRFQVDGSQLLTAWMDGVEIARKAGAPGFDKLVRKPAERYYPLLRMGVDDTDPSSVRHPFFGDFDDIRFYDRPLGAPSIELPRVDFSKVSKVEYKAFDAQGADLLVLDGTGHARTRKFTVMDHEGDALGAMVTADRPFVEHAATVDLTIGEKTITARFECPVPPGMTVEKNARNAWAGDGVELFIRPDLAGTAYFQYSANAAGKTSAMRCTAPDVRDASFASQAKIDTRDTPNGFEVTFIIPLREVFPSGLRAGESFGANFVRCGRTCSGASTWAAVGGRFNNLDAFGKVVYGGSAAYFAKKLDALKAKAAAFGRGDAAKAAADACRPVAEAVKTHGADPAAFVALETMFANADRALLQIRLSGLPLVVYEPDDVWGTRIEPDSSVRPLECVRLTLPMNGKVVYGFAIANMRDHAFVGQFKCCSETPGRNFSNVRQEGVAKHVAFSRGFPIWNRAGKELYDPVEPLAMKTLIRLAGREYAPLYIEVDAKGLAAGTYNALVYLKSGTPGYEDARFALEVTVTDLNVSAVKLDKAGYDYAGRSLGDRTDGNGGLVKLICERDYNTAFIGTMDFSPRLDKEGNFRMGPFEKLDREIEGYLKNVKSDELKLWVYMIEERHWYDPRDARGQRLPFGSEKWAEGIRFLVKNFKEHVGTKYGISPDRIWWYPVDEPAGPVEDPTWKSKIAVAIRVAEEIKRESRANLTMTDPLPSFLASAEIDAALARMRECYDIIELYRPGITSKTKALMSKLRFPQVWTYSITTKETAAAKYRRDYWENMRDGYREIATFWHMTQSAGGDTFNSTDWNSPGHLDDYATIYCNYDVEAGILSRRQLQCDQGFWDMQIIAALRKRFAGNAAKLAAIDAIIRNAADIGTIRAMEESRTKLLALGRE